MSFLGRAAGSPRSRAGWLITSAGVLLAAVVTVLGVLPRITLTQIGPGLLFASRSTDTDAWIAEPASSH
jgi:hypothetical protein